MENRFRRRENAYSVILFVYAGLGSKTIVCHGPARTLKRYKIGSFRLIELVGSYRKKKKQ